MSDRPVPDSVRTHGSDPSGTPGPPGRRLAALSAVVIAGAMVMTYLAGDPGSESDRSAITSPTVVDPTTTITTIRVADAPVPDPLDRRVPGLEGSLVLTMATPDGIEVWRWSTGSDGVLERSVPIEDTFAASLESWGAAVAAIRRDDQRRPTLVMGSVVASSPVFYGAEGFSWDRSGQGEIAWVGQLAGSETVSIHLGRWVGDGVVYKPMGILEGFETDRERGTDRLVAFDDLGLVFERTLPDGTSAVARVSLDGSVLGTTRGSFVGSSAQGLVAVTGDRTRLLQGMTLEEVGRLSGSYRSVSWSTDGRIAAVASTGTTLDLIDGSATRTVDIGSHASTVLAWSHDGRFVVATGTIQDEPVLVFVDSATLDTTTLLLSATPIAAVALP